MQSFCHRETPDREQIKMIREIKLMMPEGFLLELADVLAAFNNQFANMASGQITRQLMDQYKTEKAGQ